VHVNKSAFTPLHMYKFCSFFYKEPTFCKKISERIGSTGYCDYNINVKRVCESILKKTNIERHSAIHMNCENTIEIRIFQGTLSKERFLKNIEFIMALYDFTNSVSIKDVNSSNFTKYVKENKNQYSELKRFISNNFSFKKELE
jgi:hypothetical protein